MKDLIERLNNTAFEDLKYNFLNLNNKIPILSKGSFKILLEHLKINEENVEEQENIVFISILNTDVMGDNKGYFKSSKSNVLILNFNDIEKDIEISPGVYSRTISENQAKQILTFIERNKDKIINGKCVIHCTAGVSRSGAVGTFINDYFSFDKEQFNYFNPNIVPNPTVLTELNKLL